MNRLRGSTYIDRRTAANVINMGHELSNISERLRLFGFLVEAANAEVMATCLVGFGVELSSKLDGMRLRKDKEER
jgi:hypothetical protein